MTTKSGGYRVGLGKSRLKDTTDVTIYDVKTGEAILKEDGSPVTITVHGSDSARYKQAVHEHANERIQRLQRGGVQAPSAEQQEAREVDTVVRCTETWDGFYDENGDPLKCTHENVRGLYQYDPAIYEQVYAAIHNRKNFLID